MVIEDPLMQSFIRVMMQMLSIFILMVFYQALLMIVVPQSLKEHVPVVKNLTIDATVSGTIRWSSAAFMMATMVDLVFTLLS